MYEISTPCRQLGLVNACSRHYTRFRDVTHCFCDPRSSRISTMKYLCMRATVIRWQSFPLGYAAQSWLQSFAHRHVCRCTRFLSLASGFPYSVQRGLRVFMKHPQCNTHHVADQTVIA
jgi:hypothetical protein